MLANQLYDTLRRKGSIILNAPPSEKLSLIQKLARSSTLMKCVLEVVFISIIVGLFATTLSYTKCPQFDVGDHIRLAHASADVLLRGSEMQSNEDPACIYVSFVSIALFFVIRVTGVGLFLHLLNTTRANTRNTPQLLMSKAMVLRLRDGKCVIQTRYVSAQGHSLLDVSARMTSYVIRRTAEGESFLETKSLLLDTSNRAGCLPTSITHEISSSSPLFGLRTKEYSIDVHVKAFDEKLGQTVHCTYLYSTEDIKIGYEWESPFIISPKEVLADPSLSVTVDAEKISAAKAVSDVLQKKLTAQMERNRTDKYASLKSERKRAYDSIDLGSALDSVRGSSTMSVGTLGAYMAPGVVGSSALFGDFINGGDQKQENQSEFDNLAPQNDFGSSPVSALTSPTFTPPPAKLSRSSQKQLLFKMASDRDFREGDGIDFNRIPQKKPKFLFFSKKS